MPLTEPVARELLHLRDIELRGYRRADGLFDIEATLQDTKSYAFSNAERGPSSALTGSAPRPRPTSRGSPG